MHARTRVCTGVGDAALPDNARPRRCREVLSSNRLQRLNRRHRARRHKLAGGGGGEGIAESADPCTPLSPPSSSPSFPALPLHPPSLLAAPALACQCVAVRQPHARVTSSCAFGT
eukprot:363395-Chlamydomonas_euryale.AAC.6